MQLLDFLKQIEDSSFLESQSVICFTAPTYPLLLKSSLEKYLKDKGGITWTRIALHDQDPGSIMSQLTMSFLGSTLFYWLGSLEELDTKQKQKWLTFFSTYTGPHRCAFFTESQEKADRPSYLIVELPVHVDAVSYEQLSGYLRPELQQKKSPFVKALFASHDRLSLETVCLLWEYQAVLGTNTQEFMQSWLPRLVSNEKSLFTLSQHLFAKNSSAFFKLWSSVGPDYPEVFWVTFWSEQIWRGYYFVKMMHQNNRVEAKKVSYRLPFSFIQRDWRKITLAELKQAHATLYSIDYELKNGSSELRLDLWYATFFAREKSDQAL